MVYVLAAAAGYAVVLLLARMKKSEATMGGTRASRTATELYLRELSQVAPTSRTDERTMALCIEATERALVDALVESGFVLDATRALAAGLDSRLEREATADLCEQALRAIEPKKDEL